MLSREDLCAQLRTLGVEQGGVLLVHSSFRAVRPVEGGPAGLVGALQDAVGPGGTLVMPAWSEDDETPFDPVETPVPESLGIVPETFWRLPGVQRSQHFFAFAAAGPKAEQILADPLPLPPHRLESPVGRVWELNGQVLLLGVDHDANTTLHLAELMAEVPYGVERYCTVQRDGRQERVHYLENDHCCQRFSLANDWLRAEGLQREGMVGNATARLMQSRDLVRVAIDALQADPLVFLHPPEAACEECDEARASIRA
jgi:aminoglycoside 3-N-acetyltransferase-4